MKKLIVLGIVGMMVMGMASMASAAIDTAWAISMIAQYQGFGMATFKAGVKTVSGLSDGYDTVADKTHAPLASPPSAIVYTLPSGTPTGTLVREDWRAPVLTGTMTWDITIQALGAAPYNGALVLKAYSFNSTTDKYDGGLLSLAIMQDGKVLKDDANHDMIFAGGVTGGSATPTFLKSFDNASGQPINIQLVANAVPEPGSMVALFSGLVGLVGYGIRRRK